MILLKNLILFIQISALLALASCGKKIEESGSTKIDYTKSTKNNSDSKNKDKNKSNEVPEELKLELFRAIEANDSNLVKTALDNHQFIEYKFDNGETPLTLAIKIAKTEIISKIIQKSKDLNLKNGNNTPAIHIAIRKNNLFIVNLLLSKKVNLNITDRNGVAPIILALNTTNQVIITKLITNGASINTTDKLNRTVKETAVNLGLIKVLDLISFAEANKSVTNKAINDAVKSANTNYVDYLLNNYPKYKEIIKKRNVLITALDIDDRELRKEMIYKLLARGAVPNNTEGIPPLIYAILQKHNESIEILLNYGANVLLTDENGANALDYAVNLLNANAVRLFRANLNSKVNELEHNTLPFVYRTACTYRPERNEISSLGNNSFYYYTVITDLLGCL